MKELRMKKKELMMWKKRLRTKKGKDIIKKDIFNGKYIHCQLMGIKTNEINLKRATSYSYRKRCKSFGDYVLSLDSVIHFAGVENITNAKWHPKYLRRKLK